MATVVLGAQWGDEGKGKLVDILCQKDIRLCARAQGERYRHTIKIGSTTYDFHLLPSGLINPECMNLIGPGVVVNIKAFYKELSDLESKGLQNVRERIFIADRCHIVLDLHQLVDGLEEVELGKKSIGTTRMGIGPAYSTKASRSGIRVHEVFNEPLFEAKIRELARAAHKRWGDLLKYDVEEEITRFKGYREDLRPFVIDAIPLIQSAQKAKQPLLIEGANALMLEYVTSSNTGIAGIFTGLAISPHLPLDIIGVVKAYTTRVGGGPFPTEDTEEVGTKLQKIGREFGVTTGRPRRCGWLDLVVVKYSHAANHYTKLNITKLDVLDDFPTLKVATAYIHPETGEELASFPADLELLGNVKIKYETLKGWQKSTVGAKTYYDLPKEARAYIEYIEEFIGVKVSYIGTGPDREALISK
ncbi:Adenylosuccinate synthetase [Lachnellula hyalina]|uniref:Adenylosuccinate synthetase n=1 Tax=Lachnellula hyalina TaxID=1316788 RepID=A0A8H8R4X7_9HELO|nr:Adenylosuccinate synthetase [Lachnellula hyalina]TVY27800.1 Adenylosuccinate synthetase [Lachnellula hyalina]